MKGAATSVARGAVLTVAMRWTDQLIGIVSTLILARILVPEDFGVIAMASMIIGLTDVLFDLGVNVALIQNRHATPSHFHTAWTLRLLQAAFAATVAFLCAPLAADYFDDSRIRPVVQVLSLGLLITAFENIGIVMFQKEMRFGLDFKFAFTKRIAGFLTTVSLALALNSYWALVFGALLGRVVGVALSYRMHPMRPRPSLEKVREIFSVSQWMMVRSILGYLTANVHKFVVGGRASASIVGGYTLADQISAMPSSELLQPLNRVLFPAFVRERENPEALKRVFLLAQGVQALIAVPVSIGLLMLAPEAVGLLLGAKWMFIVPFVQVFALANVAQAVATSGDYLLITVGKVGQQNIVPVAQLTVFVSTVVALPHAGALEIAWLRVAAIFAGLVASVCLLLHAVPFVALRDIVGSVHRPIVASAVMALGLWQLPPWFSPGIVLGLIVKSLVGAALYCLCVYLLWRIERRPDGSERYVTGKLILLSSRLRPQPRPGT